MESKSVLITGGSRGIGKQLVSAFLDEGHKVIATCRDKSKSQFQKHKNLTVENLDISSTESVNSLKKLVEDMNISILVNNAGFTKDNLFLRLSDEDWEEVINTNLNGVFRVTRLVIKNMVKQRWGRVINISSISGIMGNSGQTNYSASKAGLDGFTRSLAKELGSRNITVNSVAPGFIETDMTQGIIAEDIVDKIPLKRVGKPNDISPIVLFLASDEANYITGQTLVVDGGLFMK